MARSKLVRKRDEIVAEIERETSELAEAEQTAEDALQKLAADVALPHTATSGAALGAALLMARF